MKGTKKSQKEMIKEHLVNNGSITPMDALIEYGCFRLSAVIFDLKWDDMMDIRTELVKNENGNRYAKYSLIKDVLDSNSPKHNS